VKKNKKLSKSAILGILVVLAVVAVIIGFTASESIKNRNDFAGKIFSLGDTMTSSPQTIEELRRAIFFYERRIEKHVEDAVKTGIYWKLLAIRFQDRKMHGEALEALERAAYYSPEDASIHYSIGVSAGTMAKSSHLFPGRVNQEREEFFTLSEEAYLRAIELDSRYIRPRYGLAVLYVFELGRPEEAIPHLQRCLEISRNDVDTMFVLARAYFMLENFRAALDLYDRIITLMGDTQKGIDAQINRQTVMEKIYG
jgi:tetratricopeptide (TPR) repeat protein